MSAPVDLRSEMWVAASRVGAADRATLVDLGVDPRDLDRYRMCGIERVRVRGVLYQPHPEGAPAIITPVRMDSLTSPESPQPHIFARVGPIVDLVAWHPAQPESWALRVGSAEWLGCIEPQYLNPDPVTVHRSVLDWLRAGCAGLVLLSHSPADQYRALCLCQGGITVASEEHSKTLRRALSRPWPHPRVVVANGAD